MANQLSQPNILLIITDQHSTKAMSCNGNSYVHTPAIDAIATQGVNFQNAFCCNPVCIPSRIGMFTGRYPHEAGIYLNTRKYSQELNQFPWMGKLFAAAGYETTYFGKSHLLVKPKQKKIHGFRQFKITNGHKRDHKVVELCGKFFKKDHRKPFLLVASFVNPHNICEIARKSPALDANIGNPPEVDLCPPLPSNFPKQIDEPAAIETAYQESWSHYPTKNWTETDWRQYLWSYYRLVEHIDRLIGQILEALKKSQYAKNTIIIYTSDHGEGMAEHRWNQKQAFFEAIVRVPFIIAHPDSKLKGTKNYTTLVNNGIDLIPTLLDLTGINDSNQINQYKFLGKSVKNDLFSITTPPLDQFVVSESEFGSFVDKNWTHDERTYGRMVRTARFKYIIYSKGDIREALFNCDTDPEETENVVANPKYAEDLNYHRDLFKKWCDQTHDDFPTR